MSFGTPEVIISGRSFPVLEVSGHRPDALRDFVEAASFTLDLDGTTYQVQGTGRAVDDQVRYHEKDLAHSGKDVRVWSVTRHDDDGGFYAEHAAAF